LKILHKPFSELNTDVFYNRYGQQGLILGYWNLDTESITLKPGYEYTIDTKKFEYTQLNLDGTCSEGDGRIESNYDDYLKCVDTYAKDLLKQQLEEYNETFCWIPQADFLIESGDVEACKTYKEITTVSDYVYYASGEAAKGHHGCKKPCVVPRVKVTPLKAPLYIYNDVVDLFLHWEDDKVYIEEEYLLVDFNGFLSGLGGSLGLFLGFSCLDFLMQVLGKLEPMLRRVF